MRNLKWPIALLILLFALFIVFFPKSKADVEISIGDDKIYFSNKLNDNFYNKYNEWSPFTGLNYPPYFGFDTKDGVSVAVKTNNKKISQFSYEYSLESTSNITVRVLSGSGNELFALEEFDLTQKHENLFIAIQDILILKHITSGKCHIDIVKLSNLETLHPIFPHFLSEKK